MNPLVLVKPEARPSDRDDDALVASVRDGDERAFEELYGRHHRRVAGYVRGMVRDPGRAEDVTQEVFFSALRRMRQTDGPIAFRPWIYEIARNACIDHFRRNSRTEEVSFEVGDGRLSDDRFGLVAPTAGPDAVVAHKQELHLLCGALGGLSSNHHEILVLRELEGLSYREIGDRMGLTRSAVESTLFRARRRLFQEYAELDSGRRCRGVQALLDDVDHGSSLGARERRRVARHLGWCRSCRCHARDSGLLAELGLGRVRDRVAAWAPWPLLLGLPAGGSRGPGAGGVSGVSGASLQLGVAHAAPRLTELLAPLAEPAARLAAVGALALGGVAAGLAAQPHHAPAGMPLTDGLAPPPGAVVLAGRGHVPSIGPGALSAVRGALGSVAARTSTVLGVHGGSAYVGSRQGQPNGFGQIVGGGPRSTPTSDGRPPVRSPAAPTTPTLPGVELPRSVVGAARDAVQLPVGPGAVRLPVGTGGASRIPPADPPVTLFERPGSLGPSDAASMIRNAPAAVHAAASAAVAATAPLASRVPSPP